jgi:tetratricopeptide (TPR) repeat protein
MRCPKCGHTFIVKLEGGAAIVLPIKPGAAPPAAAGSSLPRPTAPSVPESAPPKSRPSKSPEADDPFADLPSPTKSAPADLPAAKRIAAPTRPERPPPNLAKAVAAIAAKPAAPPLTKQGPPRPAITPSLDDLPAVGEKFGAKFGKPAIPTAPKPAPPKSAPDLGDLDIDLPVAAKKPVLPPTVPAKGPPQKIPPRPPPPMPTPSLELEMNLPIALGRPDLPAIPARAQPAPPVPKAAPQAKPAPPAPVPPRAAFTSESDIAFGEIDLPAIGADLPALSDAGLPEVASALPSVAASLPSVAASLPQVAHSLPAVASALPANLDSLPAQAESLPMTLDALPVHAESLPIRSSAPPAEVIGQDDLGDFGELDLPPGPLSGPPPNARVSKAPEMEVGRAGDFGDLFGPSDPTSPTVAKEAEFSDAFGDALASVTNDPSMPPPAQKAKPGGGMGFGEVDLGDAPGGGAEIISTVPEEAPLPSGPPAPVSAPILQGGGGPVLPTEIAIGTAPTQSRRSADDDEKRGKGRFVALGAFVLVVGGALLELTPYGAFGRYPISDAIHASDYQRATMATAAASRTQLLSDIYSDSKSAVDAVDSAHKGSPRARSLTAYLAVSEFEHQLRFGVDPDRTARARVALAEIPPGVVVPYASVATALQDALGDLQRGRASLDAASKRDPGDPIQEDIAYARGALELRARDGKAAQAAFQKAQAMRPSDAAKNARAHYGLARGSYLDGDAAGAKKEIDLTLTASPKHAGARYLKAKIAWEIDHDDTSALDGLASILEGAFKDSASPTEQANALSLRGDIQAARGRSADARAAYDAALQLEPHNVDALIGQGEVLFSEGRLTEALSRFDTAVQADALSVRAILSDAKGKIALEKLADAKAQLTAARAAFPKDPRVAVQLGKSDEALGDKPAAEHEYLAAIDLVDVTKVEAIEPYVALASLLAAEGRTKDAEAKLEEARSRLQDSAPMQRALGEVAAAQGNFDDAVTHYLSAIAKNPTDISTKFLLGQTYRRMGKMDLASTELDEVVASDKDYPGLSLERGLLYEESGDIDKALEQFQSALAKAPDDPDLELRVGAAYVAIGRPADAVPVLRKVLEKRPGSAEANHFLGRAIFLQGGTAQADAMRFLKRATELDPNKAEYHLYVGWAANNAIPAQLGLAKDEIDKALSLDKLLADAYWQRGVLEQKQGTVDDAIHDVMHALQLKPTRVDAHATLAACYDTKNDPNAEMAEWQKAIAGNDRVPEWRLRYGKMLLDRGSAAEAAKHLTFAANEGEKLDPRPGWLPDAEFDAAEALRKIGSKDLAIEKYRRFLEIAPTASPDRKDALNALANLGVGTVQ